MAIDTLDTNLLQSSRKPKASSAEGDAPSPAALRRKRILKGAAYALFFLWALVFFTCLKIPDSVVANFLLNSLNQNTPYQWQADSIRLGFFPWVHLNAEKLSLEPKFPGAGMPLSFDEIRIYPNPFSLLPIGGPPAVGGSFRAEAYKSTFHGSFASGSTMSMRVETSALDLARFTPLSQNGVDMKGSLSKLFLQLALPGQHLAQSDGEIQVEGKNVVFDPSSLQLGMPLPILNLGDVNVSGKLTKGTLKIEKFKLGAPGKDLEIQVPNGTLILSDVMLNTRYDLHLLIKPSPSILAAVPALGPILDGMATKRPDGFYALKIQGSFAAPAFPMKD